MVTHEKLVSRELLAMFELLDTSHQNAKIIVVGVGGGGGNAVEHMIKSGVRGVEFICANTDAQALRASSAHRVIQLGDSGLGAGSKPDKGREAAELAVDDIRQSIEGAHMLFITAGYTGIMQGAQGNVVLAFAAE